MNEGEPLGKTLAGLMRQSAAAMAPSAPHLQEIGQVLGPSTSQPSGIESSANRAAVTGHWTGRRRSPPSSVRIPAEKVMQWIALHRMPQARSIAQSGSRPGGVELNDVAMFGAGVEGGDVLFSVNGKPVFSQDDVTASVLAAEGAHAAAVSGQFWRNGGVFSVTVELPYLDSNGQLQHDTGNVANGQLR